MKEIRKISDTVLIQLCIKSIDFTISDGIGGSNLFDLCNYSGREKNGQPLTGQ